MKVTDRIVITDEITLCVNDKNDNDRFDALDDRYYLELDNYQERGRSRSEEIDQVDVLGFLSETGYFHRDVLSRGLPTGFRFGQADVVFRALDLMVGEKHALSHFRRISRELDMRDFQETSDVERLEVMQQYKAIYDPNFNLQPYVDDARRELAVQIADRAIRGDLDSVFSSGSHGSLEADYKSIAGIALQTMNHDEMYTSIAVDLIEITNKIALRAESVSGASLNAPLMLNEEVFSRSPATTFGGVEFVRPETSYRNDVRAELLQSAIRFKQFVDYTDVEMSPAMEAVISKLEESANLIDPAGNLPGVADSDLVTFFDLFGFNPTYKSKCELALQALEGHTELLTIQDVSGNTLEELQTAWVNHVRPQTDPAIRYQFNQEIQQKGQALISVLERQQERAYAQNDLHLSDSLTARIGAIRDFLRATSMDAIVAVE